MDDEAEMAFWDLAFKDAPKAHVALMLQSVTGSKDRPGHYWPTGLQHVYWITDWPVSANKITRATGRGPTTSKPAREWSKAAIVELAQQKRACNRPMICGPIMIGIAYRYPSNHRRDLDNLNKIVLDACVRADLMQDDSFIRDLRNVAILPDRPPKSKKITK